MSSRPRVRSRGSYINSRTPYGSSRDSDYKMEYSSKSREMKHSEERRRESSYSNKESSRTSEKRRESYSSRQEDDKIDREYLPSKRIPSEIKHKASYSSSKEGFSSKSRDSYPSKGMESYEKSYENKERREMFLRREMASRSEREKPTFRPSSRDHEELYFLKGGKGDFEHRSSYVLRGRREYFPSRGMSRGYRGSPHSFRGGRYERPGPHLQMKKFAIHDEDDFEDHSYRYEKMYAMRGRDKEGRSYYMSRDLERRPFRESHSENFIRRRHLERPYKSIPGRFKEFSYSTPLKMRLSMDKYRPINKRMMEYDHPRPSKRMRLSESDKYHDSSSKSFYQKRHHEEYYANDEYHNLRREFERKMEEMEEKKIRERRRSERSHSERSEERRKEKSEKKEDRGSSEDIKKEKKESSPSGMQVTVRSDGERAVNSEGNVKSRITGRLFVDLQCPHCPEHRSVTFQEYRYHLDSKRHKYRIRELTNKHSLVLRRIRLQQRNEQREIDEKWEKEHPDLVPNSVSRYCKICKLAFKCEGDDDGKGLELHNMSKLHKVQEHYLFPRCLMCRMIFPSRLVYEYHIASIRHLRIKSLQNENDKDKSTKKSDDFDNEFVSEGDLNNFITMDSVGEDEEVGSEHEEITGNLEDIKLAEREAKVDEEEDEDDEEKEEDDEDNSPRIRRRAIVEEDPVEMDLSNNSIIEGGAKNDKIFGKEYICPIEASYCKLCNKVIRTDTDLGIDAIDHHCRSETHLDHYHYLQSEDYMDDQNEEDYEGAEQSEDEDYEEDEHEGVPIEEDEEASAEEDDEVPVEDVKEVESQEEEESMSKKTSKVSGDKKKLRSSFVIKNEQDEEEEDQMSEDIETTVDTSAPKPKESRATKKAAMKKMHKSNGSVESSK